MTIDPRLILAVLCSVNALLSDTEEKRLTSQNPSVEGVEGTNVTLRCDLNPPTNLSNFIVDVNRVDLDARNNLVHAVVRGRDHSRPQMGRYKNRTRFNHNDLNRGILEMTISSVTLADTGPYNFFIKELNVNCTINLTVVPKDKHNSTMGQDSTTTGHPGKDDGAAAKNESAHAPDGGVVVFVVVFVAVVIAVVVAVVVVVVVVIGVVVAVFVVVGGLLILVTRGKIENPLRTVNRRTDRDVEVAAGTELRPLNSSTQVDPRSGRTGGTVSVQPQHEHNQRQDHSISTDITTVRHSSNRKERKREQSQKKSKAKISCNNQV